MKKADENNNNTNNENTNNATLSADETKALRAYEASIRNGLKSFYNVGKALTMIQADRLYRATHQTFAAYAKAKWDMTTARVSQLTSAYRLTHLFKMHGLSPLPATESQCRPLNRIPADELFDARVIDVWARVITSKEKITAALINSVVDDALGIKQQADASSQTTGQTTDQGADEGAESTASAEAGKRSKDDEAKAEMRATIREQARKIAYLQSALEAEKKAHQRTARQTGIPKSALAKKLMKAGFRAMAKQCHPDHGGSPEAMKELNGLKETLGI